MSRTEEKEEKEGEVVVYCRECNAGMTYNAIICLSCLKKATQCPTTRNNLLAKHGNLITSGT
ncbi:hypothetical protein JW758_06300 [Candidatus Peregrinibacteria bacterium]|nr:hypothetical protein [Candidatus Peregrinibacteria bacterium]